MPNATIYEKIEQKGIADAEKILKDASEAAKAALEASLAEARDRQAALGAKAAAKNASLLKTGITEAEQQAKQDLLAAKKTVLSQVRDQAAEALGNLSDADWKAFVLRILREDGLSGNETVVASPSDRQRFLRLFASSPVSRPVVLDILNRELGGAPWNLTLAEETASVSGGFVVRGEVFDIDHSHRALMSALADRFEGELAVLLFEGKE